jgi:hypothetical protein
MNMRKTLALSLAFISTGVMNMSHAGETFTGAQAQKSPQAETFLAYEGAMIAGGLDAASAHITPEKLEELQGMKEAFGEEGFQQFVGRMKSGAQGDARRKQIEKVEVTGDYAVLEARDNPNAVTVMGLAKTAKGWKITVTKR